MEFINLSAVTLLTSLRPQFKPWQFCMATSQIIESIIAPNLAVRKGVEIAGRTSLSALLTLLIRGSGCKSSHLRGTFVPLMCTFGIGRVGR